MKLGRALWNKVLGHIEVVAILYSTGRAPTTWRIFINSFLCHELHEFSLIFLFFFFATNCTNYHEFFYFSSLRVNS